jgi:hypothetical protein
MAPVDLLHPQVNADFDAVEDTIMRPGYRPNPNDQPQPLQLVKSVIPSIYEVWPELSPHDHLHVFAGRPQRVVSPLATTSSERFFSPGIWAI